MKPSTAELVQIGRPLRVGQLARLSGKSVRALHLYEELGLLGPIGRSESRYRIFPGSAVVRVQWIGKMQEMGFSLPEIRAVLKSWEEQHNAPEAMLFIRRIYAEKLAAAREQIQRLSELETELEASVGYLDTCETCNPEHLVSACAVCEYHRKDEEAPDLVLGINTGQAEAKRKTGTSTSTGT